MHNNMNTAEYRKLPSHEELQLAFENILRGAIKKGPTTSPSHNKPGQQHYEIIPTVTDGDLRWIASQGEPGHTSRPLTDVIRDAEYMFSTVVPIGHPRFLSFVPSAPSSVSWLGGAISDAFNAMCGSWMLSQGITTLEQSLISWLALQVGLPSSAGGIFVSGGSHANMTALTVARDQKLGDDLMARARSVAYISEETHFCVAKCLKIIGFVPRQVRTLRTTKTGHFSPTILREAVQRDIQDGYLPFLVVATCGTTNQGLVDPLNDIADIAERYNLWLHVDGAFGASAALCYPRRHLVQGLRRADSIAWDAHKWLFQTYGCGLTLVRDKRHLRESFGTTADYVQDLNVESDISNPWSYGMELSRPARHVKLWFTLQCLGLDTVSDMIEHGFKSAELLEAELRSVPGWEILSPASLAILNFRYSHPRFSEQQVVLLNEAISARLIANHVAVISTTKCRGKACLRVCMINPNTGKGDVQEIAMALVQAARELDV